MYIHKLDLQKIEQYKDREVELQKGINVIYDSNANGRMYMDILANHLGVNTEEPASNESKEDGKTGDEGVEKEAVDEQESQALKDNSEKATEPGQKKGIFSIWKMSEEQKRQMDPQLRQIMNFIKVLLVFGIFAFVLLLIYLLPISAHYKLWLCVIAVVVILYVWIRSVIHNLLHAVQHSKGKKSKKTAQSSGERRPKAVVQDSAEYGSGSEHGTDDERLKDALHCLADYGAEQIIILTEDHRITDALAETESKYHYIEL